MIGDDHDLEAIRKREVGDLRADPGLCGAGEHRAGEGGDRKRQFMQHDLLSWD
jgi:hypothetical protein